MSAARRPALRALNFASVELPNQKAEPNELLIGYELGGQIGSGSSAIVKLAIRLADNTKVAVKCAPAIDDEVRVMLKDEFEIMQNLCHPNIVEVSALFLGARNVFICMELCEDGDLYSYRRQHVFKETQTQLLSKQLFQAVDYLHGRRIVHRDLKPENCVLKNRGQTLKVIDFTCAKVLGGQQSSRVMLTHRGTRSYSAPELILGMDWNERVDVWTCGMVCYFMAFGVTPFNCAEPATKRQFQFGKLPFMNLDNCEDGLRTVITECLTVDMRQRPSAMELLFEPIFELRWQQTSSGPDSPWSSSSKSPNSFSNMAFDDALSPRYKHKSFRAHRVLSSFTPTIDTLEALPFGSSGSEVEVDTQDESRKERASVDIAPASQRSEVWTS